MKFETKYQQLQWFAWTSHALAEALDEEQCN